MIYSVLTASALVHFFITRESGLLRKAGKEAAGKDLEITRVSNDLNL